MISIFKSVVIKLSNIALCKYFSFVLLDETDEEDVQARKRRMAEKAATGILEDAEVKIFQLFYVKNYMYITV